MNDSYSLSINNFQIIRNAKITFNNGVTLLTGKSNNGKSSIFKAFKQLAYNTSGSQFITHNQSKCTLQLQHKDLQITYTKTKTAGTYSITSNSLNESLSKIGSSQPDLIKEQLHIDKDLNYNFWNQMDKPFLISLTPREQFDLIQQSPHSIHLSNCLQHLTQDRKQLATTQLQNQSKLEILQQQNSQFDQQLQNLPTLQQLHDSIHNLQQLQTKLQNLKQLLSKYESIDITKISTRLQQLHDIPTTDTLQTKLQQIDKLNTTYSRLLRTTQPVNDIQNSIKHTLTTQSQTEELLKSHFKLCPLCNQPFHD